MDSPTVWYIGGVIQKGRFRTKALAIPLTVTGLVLLGLVLGILSWPYLKVLFIGAREKLTPANVSFAAVSLILGGALVTLLLLDLIAYRGLRDRFDCSAEDIANDIHFRLRKELDETVRKLYEVGYIREGFIKLAKEEQREQRQDNQDSGNPDWRSLPWKRNYEYPPYELAFFLNEKGFQVGPQTTYRAKGVARINVPNRQYFRRAKQGPLWSLRPNGKASDSEQSFFIERIYTYGDGLKFSITAIPFPPFLDQGVVAFSRRFWSFYHAVLPAGFKFAVIKNEGGDERGRVLYHSDDSRSLVENFFLETDRKRALEIAVSARRRDHVDGQYQGVEHRFYVRPILDLPWSLVVFYDKSLLQTVAFEIGLTTAGFLLLYTGLFVIGIVLVKLFIPDAHWSWLWPQWRHNLLEFLETIVFHLRKPVLICVDILPLHRLSPQGVPPEVGEESLSADEVLRWNTLLSAFRRERYPLPPVDLVEQWKKEGDRLKATLLHECNWSWKLQEEVRPRLENPVESKELTKEQIIALVGDYAAAYYRMVWSLCTKEERLVLMQLAEGNCVNPRNVDVVARLMRRGLIWRVPDIQLPSRSFAHFVLTAEPHEHVEEWEREVAESTWGVLRVPLFLILLLIGAFVVYTGSEAVNATVGTVTALLAAFPALVRALTLFRSDRGAQPVGE